MTREEAIKMMKAKLECMTREISGHWENCNHKCDECDLCYEQGTFGEQIEWLKMAIKALEQEPCEDCIGRAEAIKALNCEISGSIESDIDLSKYKREFQEFANMILNAQEKAIQALPLVTPQPKTGHWEYVQYDGNPNIGNWHCSECNRIVSGAIIAVNPVYVYKYCPNCGCRMKGEGE